MSGEVRRERKETQMTSRFPSVVMVLVAAVLSLALPRSSSARPLAPGESADMSQEQGLIITPDLLDRLVLVDQQTHPLSVEIHTPPGQTFQDQTTQQVVASGTLVEQVLRDPTTSRLWFLYDYRVVGAGARFHEEVSTDAGNFGHGLTDVFVS